MGTLDGVGHKSVLTHPRLIIKRNQAPSRVRRFHIIGGIHGIDRKLKINDASIDTLSAALLERMYFCLVDGEFMTPPTVDKIHIFDVLRPFRNQLLRKLGPIHSILTPQEFVSLYRGRKAAMYASHLDDFYATGVLRHHSVSAAFVKCEKVNPTKSPRCIQPRHPIYNIGLGCYLKHIEHRVYKTIGKVFGDEHVVIKGYDVAEIGNIMASKWNSFNSPVGIGLDAVKFDMHVSAEMLEWEHSIYTAMYRGDKELVRLLGYQINNVGVGRCDDGKLRYAVHGRRFSGDMNTALGNCIIMCALVFSYAAFKEIPIRLVNNGDDCVVFMEREHEISFRNGLPDWFIQMGFRMTVEPPAYVLEQVEFCQMRAIETDSGHVMVRNFNTAREKDSICLNPIPNAAAMRKWLFAIGECGLALCSGIPVMQSIYQCYMRNGIQSGMQHSVQMQSGMMHLRRKLESVSRKVSATARASFMLAWNVTPDEQTALEQYYDKLELEYLDNPAEHLDNITSAPL